MKRLNLLPYPRSLKRLPGFYILPHRAVLSRTRPRSHAGEVLALELDLAARMAVQSCRIMLWQQAVVGGRDSQARLMAAAGVRALQELEHDFRAYWPLRNKGTTAKCAAFLRWRMQDYRRATVNCPPETARVRERSVH